ncbi:MAG: hypothetical protein ACI4HN_04915 [Ruminococcus sp.]
MSIAFEQGVKYVADNIGAALGGQMSQLWIDTINSQIESVSSNIMTKVQSTNLPADKLQGFVAEIWHSGTFSANAAVHHSTANASVPDVNTFGSADVKVGDNSASLKYYKNAGGSYAAQSETPYERYLHLKANAEKSGKSYESLDEFLKKRNIDKKDIHKSMYQGQAKLIPANQLLDAQKLLDRKIAVAQANGKLDQVARYQEVRDTLTDILSDHKGNKSIPLSREDAQRLTQAAKKGKLDKELLSECGLDINQLVTTKDIMSEAFSAGLKAAVLSLVISIAPTILDGISMLITEGEIDPSEFAEKGYQGLNAAAKGFLNGSITAALVACCHSGKLGATFINANASVISTAVVLMIGTLESGIKFATGKITKAQMADEIARLHITTAFSVGGGIAASVWFSEIPPLAVAAYMLGSFIGGVVGNFAYNIGKSLFMSFCVESGCTFFGIVDQNYQLPQEILDEIGIDVFDYEKFDYEGFQYDSFQFDSFSLDVFEYDKFGITIIRRGVIGVGKIGYQY